MLLMLSLLPLLSGCDNEDDVVGIFTGKTWKLSRLTNKGSNAQFYPNLWNNNEEEMKKSLDKLYKRHLESRRSFRLAQHQRKGYRVRRERCTGQGIHLRTAKCVQV